MVQSENPARNGYAGSDRERSIPTGISAKSRSDDEPSDRYGSTRSLASSSLWFDFSVEFISIAEESGHIIALGRWILKTACRRTFDWHEQGYPLIVAVNISVPQFKDQHFLNMIEETLSETNLSPAYLELEITESVLQDVTDSSKMLHSLRDQGIHCAIDDFGTGFSSLSILHQLPVHALKIDKSFVDDCPETTGGAALLPHIIAMGQTIGLTMIAEGVENEAQHLYLKSVGCHIGQGYYYARPLSEEAFSLYLKEQLPSTESNLPSAQ